ncbi:MAG: VCBS repeat-containing protein [Planctomycetota bacterium]|nr:VCBS repeat-containing protein [Planctomycetota bacterium]
MTDTIQCQRGNDCRVRLMLLSSMAFVACLAGCFSVSEEKWNERDALKNRSIALLEGGSKGKEDDKKILLDAAAGFSRIAKELPKERLGFQNLCVSLLLLMQKPDLADNPTAVASTRIQFEQAVKALKHLCPDDPIASVLMSRFYRTQNERELSIESLRAACKTSKATADTYFNLYELLEMDADRKPEYLSEMKDALKSAVKLAPSNLALGVTLLNTLAKTKDNGFKAEAERFRDMLKPLISRTNSSLMDILSDGAVAVEKGEWNIAERKAMGLRNTLLAELAYTSDLRQLHPHELEFVELEFSEQLRKQRPAQKRVAASNWRLENKQTLDFAGKDITAVATEDMDLDGHKDLVCAVGRRVDVWGTNGVESAKKLFTATLDIACKGLVLVDLDHDYQVMKDSELPPPIPNAPTSDPKVVRFLDTDVDVVVYGDEGIRLYRNDIDKATGARSLTAMPQPDSLDALRGIRTVASIDFDHDSDLDLVVSSDSGISLWSNRGNWTFADFTAFSDLPASLKNVDSILAMDLDRNVLNDFMFGADDGEQPVFLTNNLHGRYHPSNLTWKTDWKGACRAIDAIDVNADACWDLVACGKQGTKLAMMKSLGRHSWIPDQVTTLSQTPMLGLVSCDLDLDGFTDCIAWGASGLELYRGGTDGALVLDKSSLQFGQSTSQVAVMDLDRDGDEDLVCLSTGGEARFVENVGGNTNQHLEVVIRADEGGQQTARERCNMHGVGSLIELKSGGRYQAQIVRGTMSTFGLGKAKGADVMRILWTNGIPNSVLDVSNRTTIFDQQNLGGSCPYLYAWNGERFEFCTDCLWAAPIGLQFAQGVSAPTREWEYLKIDGDQVKARDGRYVLQITEELWEAAYFDAVQLMAVDHPAEVEIHTNEKVGPPDLAKFRVHTVKNRLQPRSVMDQDGKDISEIVSKRDRRYTRCWTKGINQGLVETHWMEIDLNGEDSDAEEVMLFLTGWVFPTSTSLNLAMTENPLRPKLSPPSIQVPDENGKWVEVIPYAGFPGGKTKTIAIDLSGKFKSNDHRVRVVTNMELSWDEVFWTAGAGKPEPELYRLTKLELMSAELHYRGFSELVAKPYNAPKWFDYGKVTKESIWPPMTGNFTRFGDVKELVSEADDLQVVLGAGDEMTIEFSAETAELSPGWKRDFIIYNIGWDKDADLNTIHGQSAEPLPFRAMSKYPYEPDQTFPSEPKHVDFLKRYQTRNQLPGKFWNQVREN